MTKKFIIFIFLMFDAFSMKRKRSKLNEKTRASVNGADLLGKNTWSVVHSFLLPSDEKKLCEIQKNIAKFDFRTKFQDVSPEIKGRLDTCIGTEMKWRFFKHSETQKMVAENVTEPLPGGVTALHCAIMYEEIEIAKAVIEAGVDIDYQNESGWAAVHYAASDNLLLLGRLLIEAGADFSKRDVYGNTPLDIAHWEENFEFIELLGEK